MITNTNNSDILEFGSDKNEKIEIDRNIIKVVLEVSRKMESEDPGHDPFFTIFESIETISQHRSVRRQNPLTIPLIFSYYSSCCLVKFENTDTLFETMMSKIFDIYFSKTRSSKRRLFLKYAISQMCDTLSHICSENVDIDSKKLSSILFQISIIKQSLNIYMSNRKILDNQKYLLFIKEYFFEVIRTSDFDIFLSSEFNEIIKRIIAKKDIIFE